MCILIIHYSCNSLLHNITQQQCARLQRTLNRAARIVLNVDTSKGTRHQSSVNNLIRLHWLPITHRISFKIALLTHKTLTTSSPPYLRTLLKIRKTGRCLRSSAAPLLQQHHTSNNISTRAFRHAAPCVWNSLPPDIRATVSTELFKKKLKTYYFKIFSGTFRKRLS